MQVWKCKLKTALFVARICLFMVVSIDDAGKLCFCACVFVFPCKMRHKATLIYNFFSLSCTFLHLAGFCRTELLHNYLEQYLEHSKFVLCITETWAEAADLRKYLPN